MADYINRCGSCRHFEAGACINQNTKYYCDWYKAYYYPDDSCDHYSTTAPTCYITTMVCDVLGYGDDCEGLKVLRDFRDNVLQKNVAYLPLLMEYDVVGPQIAHCIKEEYDKTHDKELWQKCYEHYLVPTIDFIKNNEFDKAIIKYNNMINSLKVYFGITDQKITIENYDMSVGGHGYIKKKA